MDIIAEKSNAIEKKTSKTNEHENDVNIVMLLMKYFCYIHYQKSNPECVTIFSTTDD